MERPIISNYSRCSIYLIFSPIRLPKDGKERKWISNRSKKNGQTVYRASVYLGVDQMTGEKGPYHCFTSALTKSA